jgi:hypothetical protein
MSYDSGSSGCSPARAVRTISGDPALLPGFDCGFLGAIAGESWADFEMRGVFQAVAPSEPVFAHDTHHHASSGREAAAPVSGRYAAKVHGKSSLMHRCSGLLCAIDPATGAATAAASAPIKGMLFAACAESAIDARSNTASTHLANGRVETRAGVIIKRLNATAPQRLRAQMRRYKDSDNQADSDRREDKQRLSFQVQHVKNKS